MYEVQELHWSVHVMNGIKTLIPSWSSDRLKRNKRKPLGTTKNISYHDGMRYVGVSTHQLTLLWSLGRYLFNNLFKCEEGMDWIQKTTWFSLTFSFAHRFHKQITWKVIKNLRFTWEIASQAYYRLNRYQMWNQIPNHEF